MNGEAVGASATTPTEDEPMRKSRRRIAFWTALAAALAALGLVGAVGASAHDGNGSDNGTQATETRGHDQEQEPARQEDRSTQQAAGNNTQDGRPLLRSTLAPSMPTDPTIDGVAPGGLPWQLERGSVLLQSNGRIRLTVKGLVIPASGTTGPVQTVTASLACPGGSTTHTAPVPISAAGDATIDTTITLPSTCLAPVILVNPNGITGAYIAVTGWR